LTEESEVMALEVQALYIQATGLKPGRKRRNLLIIAKLGGGGGK
jgi:hypothetical protein